MPNAKREVYMPQSSKKRWGVIARSLASLMARSVKGPCIAFVVLLVALMPSAIGARFAGYKYVGWAQGDVRLNSYDRSGCMDPFRGFQHVVEDDPYHVIELYDYWFMAWGGG